MLNPAMVGALAEAAFGRWALATSDEDWIRRAGITHEPTAEFLSTVGLPVQSVISCSVPQLTAPPQTFADHFEAAVQQAQRGNPIDPAVGERYADLVWIGYGAHDLGVYLDRRSGSVLSFINLASEPFLYNSSVAHLAYFAAYFETHTRVDGVYLDELDDNDAAFAAAGAIGRHFAEVDPEACRPPENNLWQRLVIDGFASGLYEEWSWGSSSVAYFVQRGIDPTVRHPRRPLGRYLPNPWAERASGP